MRLSLDHLVHFIDREPQTAEEQMRRLGLHAVAGGRHETWGTYNSLCYFDLTYIEFLAIENRSVAERETENGLIKQIVAELPGGEGVGQIALRTDRIGQLAEDLQEKGLQTTGPLPGSRIRADGSVINWQMLFAESERSGPPLPFFIQWAESDEERRRDLTNRRIIAPHPVGEIRIRHVAYAVRELAESAARWQEWFGFAADEPFVDTELNAACQTLRCGGGNILFCSPLGSGPVADVLAARGEKPFLVRFSGSGAKRNQHQIFGSVYQL
jgi:hypothetical protein